ncbi:hypothetical protein N9S29_03315, partial [SAR86 cluster bacterium]|nr:hypothetical protein [SAR86 cluster bacterium]
MLDIYQINPKLVGLLGQDSLTNFEFLNLSSRVENISSNTLNTVKDFYLLELSTEWKEISEEKKFQIFKLLQVETYLKDYDLKKFCFT